MHFTIRRYDGPNSKLLRQQLRPAHREYMAHYQDKIHFGGPIVAEGAGDPEDHIIGGFVLMEADSIDEVRRIFDEEPYQKAGVFNTVQIERFIKHNKR